MSATLYLDCVFWQRGNCQKSKLFLRLSQLLLWQQSFLKAKLYTNFSIEKTMSKVSSVLAKTTSRMYESKKNAIKI